MRAGILGMLAGGALAHQQQHWANSSMPAVPTPHVTWTTEVVTAFTTYCPGATTLTYNDKTYTVTSATTLTVTDCPCTVSRPVTTSAPAPATTTKVVTAITTFCPAPTTITHGTQTYTVTEPTTLTLPPVMPTSAAPVPSHPASAQPGCVDTCNAAYSQCRVAPGANRSTCAAQYAACLGYSPFAGNGTLVTPTACSSGVVPPVKTTTTHVPSHPPASAPWHNGTATATGPAPGVTTTTKVVTAITTYCPVPTTITHGSKTYTVSEPTTLTITDCPCTVTTTKPAVPHGPSTTNGPFRPTSIGGGGAPGSSVVPGVPSSVPVPVPMPVPSGPAQSQPAQSQPAQSQPAAPGTQSGIVTSAKPQTTGANSPVQTTGGSSPVPTTAGAGSVSPALALLAAGLVALL